MTQRLFVTVTALLVILSVSTVQAKLMLELFSPDDLDSLEVGQTVTVEVSLSGLMGDEELVSLGVDIPIDDTVFDTPTSLTAGTVVPTPMDNFTPFSVADPDLVTGAYFLDTGTTGIMTNGLFFSFNLTVDAAGSGTIALDTDSLFAEAPGPVDESITAGNPLNFTATIPEPATLAILGIGGIVLIGSRRRLMFR